MKVLGHDGDPLSVDGAEVGVFEEGDQVGLSCFLEGKHCLALEPDFLFELGGDLPHQSLEGQLPDEQVGLNKQGRGRRGSAGVAEHEIRSYALLEFSDLSQGDGSGFESVGFFHSGDDGGRFPGDFLGGQLFSGHLLGCGLPCGLLGTSHFQ